VVSIYVISMPEKKRKKKAQGREKKPTTRKKHWCENQARRNLTGGRKNKRKPETPPSELGIRDRLTWLATYIY
jgi:hypothetical protein